MQNKFKGIASLLLAAPELRRCSVSGYCLLLADSGAAALGECFRLFDYEPGIRFCPAVWVDSPGGHPHPLGRDWLCSGVSGGASLPDSHKGITRPKAFSGGSGRRLQSIKNRCGPKGLHRFFCHFLPFFCKVRNKYRVKEPAPTPKAETAKYQRAWIHALSL